MDESDGSIDGFKPWMTVVFKLRLGPCRSLQRKNSFAETLREVYFSRTKESIVYADTNPLTRNVRELRVNTYIPFKHAKNRKFS